MKKWGNIRDSFVKSLRTKTGQGFQKKYLYAEQLNFLLKVVDKADTDSNLTDTDNTLSPRPGSSTSNTPDPPPLTPEHDIQLPPPTLPARKKKTRESDVLEREILAELKKQANKENNPAPLTSRMNEKETMLLSFLPYIKDMNETEMMDLHMEILTSIRNIKQKRTLNFRIISKSPSPASSTTSSKNVYLSQLSFAPTAVTQPTVTSQQVVIDMNNQYSPAEDNDNALYYDNPLPNPQPTETYTEQNAGVNVYQNLMNQFSTEEQL